MNVSILRALPIALLVAGIAACADQPTEPPAQPEPEPEPPVALGAYKFTLTGLDGRDGPALSVSGGIPAPGGHSEALSPGASGLAFEAVSSSSFVEGVRGQGGQRYITATFRVRNSTGAPVTNLTFVPGTTASTIPGTPVFSMTLFNGTPANTAIASQLVPTGAVTLGEDLRMRSLFPDVLQVFLESEISAVALPAGTTGLFPYGFVVRNASTAGRTLPVAANANDFGGLLTFAFRYPLQATSNADPFSISFQAIAVVDSDTRMTESIEERQDTAGVRRLREKATALGATTVTVLAGSPVVDPFVTDYPGQRHICTVRTAGPSGSPTTTITMAGAYTEQTIYRTGESHNTCNPYYTSGTSAVANYGMPYTVIVAAMDRYGNIKTAQVDTINLTSTDGTAAMPVAGALSSGSKGFQVTYTAYGLSTLRSAGRRVRGAASMFVNGMTRTWGGATNTMWLTNTNWTNGMHPGAQDSVIIPGDKANYPLLVQNTAVPGVTMVDGASVHPFINLSSFDFTVSGDLEMGNNGTFTGTGRVILTGNSNTFGGGLSNVNMRNLRITGRYSTTSNVNVTGGRIVVQGGRLRSQGFRIRVRPS